MNLHVSMKNRHNFLSISLRLFLSLSFFFLYLFLYIFFGCLTLFGFYNSKIQKEFWIYNPKCSFTEITQTNSSKVSLASTVFEEFGF